MITDLLQVVPTRLIQSARNNQLVHVNNLLRADGMLASSSLPQDDTNLFQTCRQLGTSSANTSCWASCEIRTRVFSIQLLTLNITGMK